MKKLLISSVMSFTLLGFSGLGVVYAAPEAPTKSEKIITESINKTMRGVVRSVNKESGTMVVKAEGQDYLLPITKGANPKVGTELTITISGSCSMPPLKCQLSMTIAFSI